MHMAKAFDYQEMAFGMGQFHNGDIALVGGTRTGKSGTDGTARLQYAVFDLVAYASGAPGGKEKVGDVQINVRPFEPGDVPDIEGLVDITFLPKKRRNGLGRRVVEALQASSQQGLRIYDIKASARGFWRKMECELLSAARSGYLDGRFNAPEPAAAPAMR